MYVNIFIKNHKNKINYKQNFLLKEQKVAERIFGNLNFYHSLYIFVLLRILSKSYIFTHFARNRKNPIKYRNNR